MRGVDLMARPFSHSPASGRVWWRAAYWAFAAVVLAGVFIAERMTDQVNWLAGDYLAAALLLVLTGAAIEAAFRLWKRPVVRGVAVVAIFAGLAIVWALLATR